VNRPFPITGTSDKVHVIYIWGDPLDYTLSPFFQEHALSLCGHRIIYKVFRGNIEEFRQLLKSRNCIGANITAPHKQKAVEICEELSDRASKAGSVNTIYKKDGKFCGDSTDGAGLVEWLKYKGVLSKKINIAGNGGSAMSICQALAEECVNITVYGREEKEWEKKFGIFRNMDEWERGILLINTLPFEINEENVMNISYSFEKITEDAAGMLAFQGFLSAQKWFPDMNISESGFLKIVFIHRQAALNNALVLKFAGMK
jgi:shikimate 5-dehydrogenase